MAGHQPETTMNVDIINCCQCGKQRGKKNKPWNRCVACDGHLCLNCSPANRTRHICSKCWQSEYEAELKLKAETPVECVGCHKKFLPEQMENPHVPTVCKDCNRIVSEVRDAENKANKKKNARPGLVEVVYGEFQPSQDGGRGYAYHNAGLDLELGDVVLVPASWVDKEIHGKYDPNVATVVSTYSDYNGAVQSIVGLVKKGNELP